MAGQFLLTQVENNNQVSTTATTQQTATIDVPRSNFLSALFGQLRIRGVGTPTLTLDKVRLIANGSLVLWDTEGGQMRGVHKFEQGSHANGVLTSTTDLIWKFVLRMGRFARDTRMILPAKAFKSLQLQLIFTPGAGTSVTFVALDLAAEEYVSDDPIREKIVRKVNLVSTTAAAANLRHKQRLPLGNVLRAVYLHTDDLDNVGANGPGFGGTDETPNEIRVLVNNGAEIPFSMRSDMLRDTNVHTYRFDDADTPNAELSNAAVFTGTEEMWKIDFDLEEDLSKALDTGRMNELQVEFTAAGSGTSGDTHIITEEILAGGA